MANMLTEYPLSVLPGRLAICRLDPQALVPPWAQRGALFALVRTPEELSLICPEAAVPDKVRAERGWRAMRVVGVLDFALTGVLASLLTPLADAQVSVFALSTFDTDYILVKEESLPQAMSALRSAGFRVLPS